MTKFYEVVIEGNYKVIKGLLEGFLLGSGKNWIYYFSKDVGIKTETLGELLKELVSLHMNLHHIVMDQDLNEKFTEAVSRKEDSQFVNKKYIRSAKEIKKGSFEFESKTYGRKYGEEIKAILKNLPSGLELHNYNPIEKDTKEGKGIELYAPEHDYIFEATGKISGSDIKSLIEFRKILDDHPLVEVRNIELKV